MKSQSKRHQLPRWFLSDQTRFDFTTTASWIESGGGCFERVIVTREEICMLVTSFPATLATIQD
jgi:hypothetical protein